MSTLIKLILVFYYVLVVLVIDGLYLSSGKKRPYIILMLSLTVATISLNLFFNLRLINVYVPVLMFLCINNFVVFRERKGAQGSEAYKFTVFLMLVPVLAMAVQLFNTRIYNYDFYASLLTQAIIVLLLFLVFRNNSRYIHQDTVLQIICVFSFINSILGFMQVIFNKRFTPGSVSEDVFEAGFRRVYGFAGGINAAGNLSAILFIITIYILYRKRTRWNLLVFALNLVFLVMNMTRIAYLGAAAGLLLIFLFFRDPRKRGIDILLFLKKSLILIICLIILFFSYQIFLPGLYDYLFTKRGATHQHRIDQFQAVWELIREHPVKGVGAGQYSYVYAEQFNKIDLTIHSQWLSILTEKGVIVLSAFILFELMLFCFMIKKYESYSWFVIALFVTRTIVSNFNGTQYYFVVNNIFYFTVFGLIFSGNNYMGGIIGKKDR